MNNCQKQLKRKRIINGFSIFFYFHSQTLILLKKDKKNINSFLFSKKLKMNFWSYRLFQSNHLNLRDHVPSLHLLYIQTTLSCFYTYICISKKNGKKKSKVYILKPRMCTSTAKENNLIK